MAKFEGEYSGAALASFIQNLGPSLVHVEQILQRYQLERVDPDAWYPLDLAAALYADFRTTIGARTLYATGKRVSGRGEPLAAGPDIKVVLSMLPRRYAQVVRGENSGFIECSMDDDHGAVLVYKAPFPCAYRRGIVSGYCESCGTPALIEHGAGGCMDDGADACVYRVSW